MTAATPDQVRQITQEVLSRPEFQSTDTWKQVLASHIFDWLRDLARWSSRNPNLSKFAIIALSIVLLALIAHIVYTVVSEFATVRRRDVLARRAKPLRALEGIAENWNEAFTLARAALEAGDSYKGIWITHRVLLSVLDRMNRIKFVRWKTNTDYLRECGDSDDSGATLFELTSAYDRVVYAHGPFDRVRAVQLLAKVEDLAARAGA
jgi:hypothetical protein